MYVLKNTKEKCITSVVLTLLSIHTNMPPSYHCCHVNNVLRAMMFSCDIFTDGKLPKQLLTSETNAC